MASQESLFSVGTRFGLAASTVMNIVNQVLYLAVKLKNTYIRFPAVHELPMVSEGFKNYPGK